MRARRGRRHDEEHTGGQERWLVSYADFITLLFAFFTVLFATSERNVKKQKEFESSVRQSFQAFIPNGTPTGPGEYAAYNKSNSMVAPPLDMYQHKQTNTSYEDELRLELVQKMGKKEFSTIVSSTQAEPNGVRLNLLSGTVFGNGSARIASGSSANLDKLVNVLASTGKHIVVEGRTRSDSWELSSTRASTLARYLATKNIPADRLSAVAYAEPKSNSDARSANTQIDILVQTAPEH
jgi:chemotaxis protein MotB